MPTKTRKCKHRAKKTLSFYVKSSQRSKKREPLRPELAQLIAKNETQPQNHEPLYAYLMKLNFYKVDNPKDGRPL
jgi:hypothetical protein